MRRVLAAMAAAVLGLPAAAFGFEVHPEFSIGGWFFGIDGTIEGTDLEGLDFDTLKPQPEFSGGVRLGARHHLGISYLRVRRFESGTVENALIFGLIVSEGDASIDLDVDYLRGHYGFSLLSNETVDLQPFVEVGYLREATDIAVESQGMTERNQQSDSAVFPLPGLEVLLWPRFPVGLRGRASGIGTGQGHLIDLQAGIEGRYQWAFGGLGYRHIDFLFEDGGEQVADLTADGLYLEGGIRF